MPRNRRLVDTVLTTHAKGYKQGNMIADEVLPVVFVNERGGQVVTYGKENFVGVDDTRQPGSNTARITTPQYTGEKFALQIHGLEGFVPDEERDDAAAQAPGLDLGRVAVDNVMARMTLNREIETSQLVLDINKYPASNVQTLAATEQFNAATSDPLELITAAKETIRGQIGMYPNTLIVSAKVAAQLMRNAKIMAHFSQTRSDSISLQLIAQYLMLDRVIVGMGIQFNPQTGLYVDLWGRDMLLTYTAPSRGVSLSQAEPSFGYTYTFRGHPLVRQPYYEDNRVSWFYPMGWDRDPVISCPEAGYLFKDAVAA